MHVPLALLIHLAIVQVATEVRTSLRARPYPSRDTLQGLPNFNVVSDPVYFAGGTSVMPARKMVSIGNTEPMAWIMYPSGPGVPGPAMEAVSAVTMESEMTEKEAVQK